MNYLHAYHAGNFADVVKHVILTRVICYLQRKDKGFRVIDTHAGSGHYRLDSEAAQRTGEWRDGIGRVVDAELPASLGALIQPYLEALSAGDRPFPQNYPGSPLLARRMLRNQDRLTACELRKDEYQLLAKLFAGDFQVRTMQLDGWLIPGSQLPPKEKRGVVLIDPPFEQDGEFDRLIDALQAGHRRWPGGIYLLWYPIKHRREVEKFRAALKAIEIANVMDVRMTIRTPSPAGEPGLDGSGMIVVNAPYTLETELRQLLPWLVDTLRRDEGAEWSISHLTDETAGKDQP
jgi:23S rRNA (adenine2030-N6)-methyltransferase